MGRANCWIFPVVPLFVGCASSVTFEGIEDLEDFGGVGSAVWAQQDFTDEDGVSRTFHYFLLSHEPGMCDAYGKALEAYDEVTADLDAAFSGQAQYDIYMDAYAVMDQHMGPYFSEGSTIVRMFTAVDEAGSPLAGEHSVGSGVEDGAFVYVYHYTADLFTATADSLYVEDDLLLSSAKRYCHPYPDWGVDCKDFYAIYTASPGGWVDLSRPDPRTVRMETRARSNPSGTSGLMVICRKPGSM